MNNKLQPEKIPTISLIFALTIGFGLRIYHLGFHGFWFDEIGVANVAYAGNILEILRISKSHVMAMPLDYIVAYLISRIDNSEFVLRIPAMIWGSISIVALYYLGWQLSESRTIAFFSALFLAISPIHVYYSQELRFYTVLAFFILTGTLALHHTIKFPTMKNWLVYHAVILIGCFFHIYVLFVPCLGAIWLFLIWRKNKNISQIIGQFSITNINILIIVFAAVFLLTSNQHPGTIYSNYFRTILNAVGAGTGFLPLHLDKNSMGIIFIVTFMIVPFIIGFFHFLHGKAGLWNRGIAFFIPISVVIILLLDFTRAYYIQSRQFLFILPFVLYVSAYGLVSLARSGLGRKQYSNQMQIPILVLYLIILFGVNGISLYYYYQTPKSYMREIIKQIKYPAISENTIYIAPPYDVGSFLYYYQREFGKKYPGRLIGFEGQDMDQLPLIPGDFVVVDSSLEAIDTVWLKEHDLRPVLITHPLQNNSDVLWLLPDSPDS